LPGESNDGKVKEARWQSLIGLSHGGEYPKHRKFSCAAEKIEVGPSTFSSTHVGFLHYIHSALD